MDTSTPSEKRDFIGGLIAASLAKKGVDKILDIALSRVAARDEVPMQKSAVQPVKEEVLHELQDDFQARVEHQLDLEPHKSSRNVWGSVIGILTAIETIRVFWFDDTPQTFQEYMIPVGIIVTALTPLYSRFIAKKPLFR